MTAEHLQEAIIDCIYEEEKGDQGFDTPLAGNRTAIIFEFSIFYVAGTMREKTPTIDDGVSQNVPNTFQKTPFFYSPYLKDNLSQREKSGVVEIYRMLIFLALLNKNSVFSQDVLCQVRGLRSIHFTVGLGETSEDQSVSHCVLRMQSVQTATQVGLTYSPLTFFGIEICRQTKQTSLIQLRKFLAL